MPRECPVTSEPSDAESTRDQQHIRRESRVIQRPLGVNLRTAGRCYWAGDGRHELDLVGWSAFAAGCRSVVGEVEDVGGPKDVETLYAVEDNNCDRSEPH